MPVERRPQFLTGIQSQSAIFFPVSFLHSLQIAAIVLAAIGNHGGVGLANMLILAFANVQMVVVLVQCLLFFAPSWRAGRCAVDRCYK